MEQVQNNPLKIRGVKIELMEPLSFDGPFSIFVIQMHGPSKSHQIYKSYIFNAWPNPGLQTDASLILKCCILTQT